MTDLPALPLPSGIRTRMVPTDTGLTHHVLEAGQPGQPMLLLLHGFPELAFSWRKVMVPLAEAGFHVVAPDQRGYGRTTGWDSGYDDDLSAFSVPCMVRDQLALVRELGAERVHCLIGHDFGARVAAWSAMIRPDVFPRLICMSSPFPGPPAIAQSEDPVHAQLLALDPPRKHYQWYYSTRAAEADMMNAPEGMHAFLRAYFHMKSADWTANKPFELAGWSAPELARMPNYYIMQASENMAESVAPHDPGTGSAWMPDTDMAVFAAEYERTGLQGALNSYRCSTSPRFQRDLSVYQGHSYAGPATFFAGQQDWGWAQFPGALHKMATEVCADWRGTHLIEGSGHWLQQERPEAVLEAVFGFLNET